MKKPIIKIERREKPAPVEPRYKWLLPLLIGIAAAVLIAILVYTIATGVVFG